MNRENALLFGRRHRLVGLVTEPGGIPPGAVAAGPAVILLNAGLIHRIGPRRLHVTLARRLAAHGLRVLRMDLSGIGDSESRKDELSAVDGMQHDVREAMDALAERYQVREFVLFGICSGAKIAFKVALRDPRVVGALLIDPGDFGRRAETSPASGDSAFVQHYVRQYWRSVFAKGFDLKRVLGWFTGKANYQYACKVLSTQARGFFRGRKEARETRADVLAEIGQLAARGVRLLLLYGDQGASLDFFEMMLRKPVMDGAFADRVAVQIQPDTTHTFVTLESQAQLLHAVRAWFRPWEGVTSHSPHEPQPAAIEAASALATSDRRSGD